MEKIKTFVQKFREVVKTRIKNFTKNDEVVIGGVCKLISEKTHIKAVVIRVAFIYIGCFITLQPLIIGYTVVASILIASGHSKKENSASTEQPKNN